MADVVITKSDLELTVERIIAAPVAMAWRCWAESDLLKQWYCPKPWRVTKADFDLRPGGRMNTVMEGPDGERFENEGVWLEIVHERRLVFTDAFTEDYWPTAEPFMTGVVEFAAEGESATRFRWSARHATKEAVQKHLEMGFEGGWTAASAQLDELARSL